MSATSDLGVKTCVDKRAADRSLPTMEQCIPQNPAKHTSELTPQRQKRRKNAQTARQHSLGTNGGYSLYTPPMKRTVRLKRGTQRGFSAIEELLTAAALLGCFVYPLSLAARSVGARLAGEMDLAHATILAQKR